MSAKRTAGRGSRGRASAAVLATVAPCHAGSPGRPSRGWGRAGDMATAFLPPPTRNDSALTKSEPSLSHLQPEPQDLTDQQTSLHSAVRLYHRAVKQSLPSKSAANYLGKIRQNGTRFLEQRGDESTWSASSNAADGPGKAGDRHLLGQHEGGAPGAGWGRAERAGSPRKRSSTAWPALTAVGTEETHHLFASARTSCL